MTFDFDKRIDRRGTNSLKWDRYKGEDIIPLWVADMDFQVSPDISKALRNHVDHGVFGYTLVPGELVDVVIERLAQQYNWKVKGDWIVWLPGLVTGINLACLAVGDVGNEVLTTVPIYPPFLTAPGNSSRTLGILPLVERSGGWGFDFEQIENAITPRTNMFLLCNPHNPTGRIFTGDELSELANICERHDLVICSDEIHCELLLDKDKKHIPTATLSQEVERRTITLMAPSKTFNIPGLGCAFAIISDEMLRRKFLKLMQGTVPHINAFGYTAALAAYRDSRDWHMALIEYLRKNRDMVESFIKETPGLSMQHVEATYLAWIDARQSGLDDPAKSFEKGGVGLSDGKPFGAEGFLRLNFGCCSDLLKEALQRIGTIMK